jgi:hypothetical protein
MLDSTNGIQMDSYINPQSQQQQLEIPTQELFHFGSTSSEENKTMYV